MPLPISAPANAVPLFGMAFSASGQEAMPVDIANPLPVSTTFAAAASVPLTGSASSAGVSAAFTPQIGRELVLTLSGAWTGTVSLLRSIDDGATKLPATLGGNPLQWAGNVNEIVWVETEAAAALYLQLAPTSGTIAYRVAQ